MAQKKQNLDIGIKCFKTMKFGFKKNWPTNPLIFWRMYKDNSRNFTRSDSEFLRENQCLQTVELFCPFGIRTMVPNTDFERIVRLLTRRNRERIAVIMNVEFLSSIATNWSGNIKLYSNTWDVTALKNWMLLWWKQPQDWSWT
jgi:hypothetical protein